MTKTISTEHQLRKLIPEYPKMLDKRILSSLDGHCMEFIGFSRMAALAVTGPKFCFHLLAAGVNVLAATSHNLSFAPADPAQKLSELLLPGQPVTASLLFTIPGVGHALRVNGVAEYNGYPGTLNFTVRQAYFHCARAVARADLWQQRNVSTATENEQPNTLSGFLAACPYLLLKTEDRDGHTEISPRGDSPGFTQIVDQEKIFMPERPGNKIAKSLRNILATGRVNLLGFIPGLAQTCEISGRAFVSAESSLLDGSIERGKRPKLGIVISDVEWRIETTDVLVTGKAWDRRTHVDSKQLTSFSKALAEHMNGSGLLGKATSQVVKAVVKHDMKHLY